MWFYQGHAQPNAKSKTVMRRWLVLGLSDTIAKLAVECEATGRITTATEYRNMATRRANLSQPHFDRHNSQLTVLGLTAINSIIR